MNKSSSWLDPGKKIVWTSRSLKVSSALQCSFVIGGAASQECNRSETVGAVFLSLLSSIVLYDLGGFHLIFAHLGKNEY